MNQNPIFQSPNKLGSLQQLIVIVKMIFRNVFKGASALMRTPMGFRNLAAFGSRLVRTPKYCFSQMDHRPQSNSSTTPHAETGSELAAKSVGLSKFLKRTYASAGLGFMGALGSAWLSLGTAALYTNPGIFALGGFIMTLVGLIGCQSVQPTYITEYVNGHLVYKTANSPGRIALYAMGLIGLGMTAAPAIGMVAMTSPSTIPMAMAMTAAIFGGASLAAYNIPTDKMASIGKVLMGSLLGLIGLQLVGFGSYLFMGPNALSSLLFRADNYLGILLFSGFVAYDTHVAINSYESGAADHLGMSVQFLLDVWNIFIRLLYLFSQRD